MLNIGSARHLCLEIFNVFNILSIRISKLRIKQNLIEISNKITCRKNCEWLRHFQGYSAFIVLI